MIIDDSNFDELEHELLMAVISEDYDAATAILRNLNGLQASVMLCQVSGVLSGYRFHRLAEAAKAIMNDDQTSGYIID